jgi:Uma2 family endonuclease
MTVADKKKFTYDDYLKMPEDERYELIEGELLMSPSPATKHQKILRELVLTVVSHVKKKALGEVFFAPYDIFFDDENVLQPDLIFVSKDNVSIITEKNIHGSPDLVVEILSESTAYRDLIQKKKLYERFGVKEYWVVAPDDELVEVYILTENGGYQLSRSYIKEDTLTSRMIKGLQLHLKEIFA